MVYQPDDDASVGPAAPDESTEPGSSVDETSDDCDGTVTPAPVDAAANINTTFIITALVERYARTTYPELSDQEHELLLESLARETAGLSLAPGISRTTRAEMATVRDQYLKAIDDSTREAVKKLLQNRGIEAAPGLNRQQLEGTSRRYASIPRNQSDTSLVVAGMKRDLNPGFFDAPAPAEAVKSEMTSNFYVLGEIGKGGFGTVYRAQHKLDRAEYAIKKIPLPPPGKSEKARYEALLTEIRSMARLEHGNIVRYYNSWIGVEHFGPPPTTTASTVRPTGRIPSAFSSLSGIPEASNTVDGGSFIKFGDSSAGIDITQPKSSVTPGFIFEELDETPVGSPSFQQPTFESAISHTDSQSETFDSTSDSGPSMSIAFSASPIPSPPKNALVRRKNQYADTSRRRIQTGPIHCLNIVMSLYPITLKDYLLCTKEYAHCFCPLATAQMFLGIISGIEYLHTAGLIHRDIKPGNIFLTPGPVMECCRHGKELNPSMCPKIGDFGLVTAISPVNALGESQSTPDLGLTPGPSTKRVGTSFYIPPEGGEHCGVDVWALGLVLCEMLYKFDTQQERAVVLNTLTKSGDLPADVEKVVKEKGAWELIKGCTMRKPALRWTIPKLKSSVEDWIGKLRLAGKAETSQAEKASPGAEESIFVFDGLDVAAL
ncbi:kinase-like protein [Ascodesmis nigricans]|uniref:Kinase-like protein n=1 Tax=Ascodesmis nigricans TaxID=341454 RepID=A0A4S2MZG7_9PEZI|nr:kinase-like protein [Ascodesmis nigricans]